MHYTFIEWNSKVAIMLHRLCIMCVSAILDILVLPAKTADGVTRTLLGTVRRYPCRTICTPRCRGVSQNCIATLKKQPQQPRMTALNEKSIREIAETARAGCLWFLILLIAYAGKKERCISACRSAQVLSTWSARGLPR